MRRKRHGAETIQPRSAPRRAATNRASTMGVDGALNIRKWNVTACVFCAPNTTSTIATSNAAISFSELTVISLRIRAPIENGRGAHYHLGERPASLQQGLRSASREPVRGRSRHPPTQLSLKGSLDRRGIGQDA